MLNRKVSILLVVAIIIGLLLFFVSTCHRAKKPDIIPAPVVIKQIEKSKDTSDKKIAVFQKSLDSAKKVNQTLTAKLNNQQAINNQLRTSLLNVLTEKDTTGNDYTQVPDISKQLIESSKIADSLCTETVGNLNGQITNLYKMNYEKDTAYIRLKEGSELLAKNQEELQKWGNKLNRQFTGLKIGNKIWKGAAIVAGIYILKTVLIK
jgi:hypothetical protein